MSQDYKPIAKSEEFIVSVIDNDLVIFDPVHNHVHTLDATLAQVWQLCDGTRSLADISRQLSTNIPQTVEYVDHCVTELVQARLVDDRPSNPPLPSRLSRRRWLRKATAAGIAVPAVISVSVNGALATSNELTCIDPGNPLPQGACFGFENNDRCCRDNSGCIGYCNEVCNPYPFCVH